MKNKEELIYHHHVKERVLLPIFEDVFVDKYTKEQLKGFIDRLSDRTIDDILSMSEIERHVFLPDILNKPSNLSSILKELYDSAIIKDLLYCDHPFLGKYVKPPKIK